eukprot:COSAG02_NODE_10_length_59045_cov_19.973365_21_plen_62_part_00
MISELFSASSFVAEASAFDVEHSSKIKLKDDWSESPVLLEERDIRVGVTLLHMRPRFASEA